MVLIGYHGLSLLLTGSYWFSLVLIGSLPGPRSKYGRDQRTNANIRNDMSTVGFVKHSKTKDCPLELAGFIALATKIEKM